MKSSFYILVGVIIFTLLIFVNLHFAKQKAVAIVMEDVENIGVHRMYDEMPYYLQVHVILKQLNPKEWEKEIIDMHVDAETNYQGWRWTSYLVLLILFIAFIVNIEKGIKYLYLAGIKKFPIYLKEQGWNWNHLKIALFSLLILVLIVCMFFGTPLSLGFWGISTFAIGILWLHIKLKKHNYFSSKDLLMFCKLSLVPAFFLAIFIFQYLIF